MDRTIYSDSGDRIVLDPDEALASGGEGSVFVNPLNPNHLIKIYENPTDEHGRKLQAFIAKQYKLPNSLGAPLSLWHRRGGLVVGYEMPFFKNTKPFRKLAVPNFRLANSFFNKKIGQLHLNHASLISQAHSLGITFGDLNDLNSLFSDTTPYIIDIDSVQFDNWPCPVAAENFLDPNLYNVILQSKPSFVPENDWYSFAVILFRSLLIAHPYGGTHPTYAEIPDRAIRHITCFSKDVIYPTVALPPELLSDDLSQVFHRYFNDGWRGTFPQNVLSNFVNALISCPSCMSDYPKNRRTCPVCNEQNKAVTSVSLPGAVTLRQLLGLKGQVLYSKLEGDKLVVISLEAGFCVMNIVDSKSSQRIDLFPFVPGMNFEASPFLLAVNLENSESVDLYEIRQGRLKHIDTIIADIYSATQSTIYRINGKNLYRIVGGHLVRSEVQNGKILNYPIRQIIERQTWFTASSDSNPILVGFHRVLRQQFFWLYSPEHSTDLNLPQMDNGEKLVDLSVKFSSTAILIIRRTTIQGSDLIRFDLIDRKGKLISSTKFNNQDLPEDTIHGLAFGGNKLIFPADTGCVRFDPQTGEKIVFSATNKIVHSGQALYGYLDGLLVLDTKSIGYLTLN